MTANWRRNSGLVRHGSAKVRRQPENPRLVGCAGRLQRTALRWVKFPDHWESRGNFLELRPIAHACRTYNRLAAEFPGKENREFSGGNTERQGAKGRSPSPYVG